MNAHFKKELKALQSELQSLQQRFEELRQEHEEWMDEHEDGWEYTAAGERADEDQSDLESWASNLEETVSEIDDKLGI